MDQFKTFRGKALNEYQGTPILGKLWLAACDYRQATTDQEFIEEDGIAQSAEDFRHDLFIFLTQSSHYMHAQGVKYDHWPIQP